MVRLSTVNGVDSDMNGYYSNHMEIESFGQRLKRLRERAGFSARELARRAGLGSHASISQAESGQGWNKRPPSSEVTQALADALGVTRDELEKGTPPPAAPSLATIEARIDRLVDGEGVRDGIDAEIMADLSASLSEIAPREALDTLREMRESEPAEYYRYAVAALAQAFKANMRYGGKMLRLPRVGRETDNPPDE